MIGYVQRVAEELMNEQNASYSVIADTMPFGRRRVMNDFEKVTSFRCSLLFSKVGKSVNARSSS